MRDVYGIDAYTTAFKKHPGMSFGDLAHAASDEAYRMAGLGPQDMDVAELRDATSFGEIYQYEIWKTPSRRS